MEGFLSFSRGGISLWVVTLREWSSEQVGWCYDERDWVVILCRRREGDRSAPSGVQVQLCIRRACDMTTRTWNFSQPLVAMYSVAR